MTMIPGRSLTRVTAPRCALVAAAALLALPSLVPTRPLRAEPPGVVLLEISGAPDARFSGACRVGQGPSSRTIRLDGHPPIARRFAASAVRCDIVNAGDAGLVVTLRKLPGGLAQSALCCRGSTAIISLQ